MHIFNGACLTIRQKPERTFFNQVFRSKVFYRCGYIDTVRGDSIVAPLLILNVFFELCEVTLTATGKPAAGYCL